MAAPTYRAARCVVGRHGSHDTAPATRWEDGFRSGDGDCGLVMLGDPLAERLLLSGRRYPLPGSSTDQQGHRGVVIELDRAVLAPAADYRREADFRTGEVTVHWTDVSGSWRSRAFVSRADKVLVYDLVGPAIDLTVRLSTSRPDPGPQAETGGPGEVLLTIPGGATGPGAVTRLVAVDGPAHVDGAAAVVRGALRLVLLAALDRSGQGPALRRRLAALPIDYPRLLRRHVALQAPAYERMELGFGLPAGVMVGARAGRRCGGQPRETIRWAG
ncbi:glycoside hydrolase N-terminal domain-containing protein [Pseudonocardia sp. CA-107938]|uniref:glycoside hydrolase N-terminal domain-containing protein n=1 Tax=Pseudonocardia sp. CA-107938 TaxID=3240021 RepID=UPI003D8BA55B